ncbi:hypothetical protein [Ferruginibacter albus]|uniref:hypothetical protein n=1 Tax=Ferruginibacter albus TaxID=2875540 RepID=UPI001CC55D07|nr:hypothetical protein [Ferruginibacter albus]UAY51355.1 hypothetical protein K9M53_12250 [Ferruginibacter albus]
MTTKIKPAYHLLYILVLNTFFFLCPFISFSQINSQTIILDDSISSTYTIKDGRITGKYSSYYKNGVKKSEGYLQNGYRIGDWKVWDAAGNLKMERNYKTILEFDRIYPKSDTSGAIPMLMNHPYKIKYNEDGYVDLFNVKAEFAIWRNRNWRFLNSVDNKELFNENRLYKIICAALLSKKQTAFEDERFKQELSFDTIASIIKSNNSIIIGYKIKEELIFDLDRMVFEYRILGISPQIKSNDQSSDLFWVYYPDFRKIFAGETIKFPSFKFIKSIDDLFFYRDFSSTLIKTSLNNPFDMSLKNFPGMTADNIQYEQKILECEFIESENDIWLNLAY